MAEATQSAHAALDELRQRATAERVKQRDLTVELEAAKAEVDAAGDAITEGYALEDERLATRHAARQAVDRARKEQEAAIAKVRDLQHRVDAAGLRVERAQRELDDFQRERAGDLLEEREGEARELAAKLTAAGLEAVRLHRAYLTLREDIASLVVASSGEYAARAARDDGPPATYPWEQQLRDLDRAVRATPEVPPPLPRWTVAKQRQEEEDTKRIVREPRGGRAHEAALAIGRMFTER